MWKQTKNTNENKNKSNLVNYINSVDIQLHRHDLSSDDDGGGGVIIINK